MLYLLNSGYFGSHKQLEIYPLHLPKPRPPPAGAQHSPTAPHRPRGQKLLHAYTHSSERFLFFALSFRGFALLSPLSTRRAAWGSSLAAPRPPSPCPAPCLLAGFPLASRGTSSTRSSPSKIPFPTIQQPLSPRAASPPSPAQTSSRGGRQSRTPVGEAICRGSSGHQQKELGTKAVTPSEAAVPAPPTGTQEPPGDALVRGQIPRGPSVRPFRRPPWCLGGKMPFP